MPAMRERNGNCRSNFAGMARSYRIIVLNLMVVTQRVGTRQTCD